MDLVSQLNVANREVNFCASSQVSNSGKRPPEHTLNNGWFTDALTGHGLVGVAVSLQLCKPTAQHDAWHNGRTNEPNHKVKYLDCSGGREN